MIRKVLKNRNNEIRSNEIRIRRELPVFVKKMVYGYFPKTQLYLYPYQGQVVDNPLSWTVAPSLGYPQGNLTLDTKYSP